AGAVSGDDVPVESGQRSDALLAELAEAERARVRAEARVSQLVVDIDQARTIEASQHSTNTRSCKPICHYYGPATRTAGSTPGASTSSPKPHETPSPIQP